MIDVAHGVADPDFCVAIWLVGSRAKGTAHEASDYDVVLVAEGARSIASEWERLPSKTDAAGRPLGPLNSPRSLPDGRAVDLVVVNPSDWATHASRFMVEARACGIRIYSRPQQA